MNLLLSLIVIFGAVVATYAEADPQYPYYGGYGGYGYGNPAGHFPYPPAPYGQPHPSYFRAGYPQPSIENNENSPDTRLFFGTVTVTLATTTSTSTVLLSTTCTTSARAISICSPSGRRRRGLGLNTSQKARGLFYNDEEEESETGSIFTRSDEPEVVAVAPVEDVAERQSRSTPATVPFVVQPGFNAPEGIRGGRFYVAFGTSTSIITTTSTYTAILTAACRSTTSFNTCQGTGK
ncbi:uncharacterized protein LOC124197398 isoform X2 [Daphnia pulex]|uniref:uncharacterized protein LOC124328841 n=1 Tax=Daphnia pulicaria TaxID=35523 RepID=UPI001EE09A69|nr:uncharacterized protein LOC124197398 isoform X2 [Daphnia pulex]XP_046643608.1 uncharacterized protein LOC124328841 [Daphnia pulicaria]